MFRIIRDPSSSTYTTTICKHTKESKHNTHTRVINLSNTNFNHEHIHTLSLGPNFAIEKEPKYYINNLIIDTENAIRHLDTKVQNTFRYIAANKIKQITTTNRAQTMHKTYQHNINEIKNILRENNLTITKADKNKAIVIINKAMLEQKVQTFVKIGRAHV